MSARDSFSVFLRDLPFRDIGYHVTHDGRHVLDITRDVQLCVRPEVDDLDTVVEGLRQLGGAASEMAEALDASGKPGPDDPPCPETSDSMHCGHWHEGGQCCACGQTGPKPGEDERCPDCGRESCTGEGCYWPDEAGIRGGAS